MVSLSSRRRTLSRSDVAQAIAMSDVFDFLIDIVPRDDATQTQGQAQGQGPSAGPAAGGSGSGSGGGSTREAAHGQGEGAGRAPVPRRTTGRRTRQVPEGDEEDEEVDVRMA